jgi:hypothetical protein
MTYWLAYFLILIGGSGVLLLLLNYFYINKASILVNISLIVLSLFLTMMGLEFYFKNFFAEPDIVNTLARQNWRKWYHEEPVNSLGYRDIEWTDELVADKVKVMVAGDSFVVGAGIAKVADRFSNQLAAKLGPDYVVFNVGQNGLNSGQVIRAILDYPYKPDILVFSYYLNDIESVSPPCRGTPNSAAVPSLAENSYAANFFYWRLVRLQQSTQPDLRGECLVNAYNDPKIWWLHQQELLSVYEGAKSEQIPLFVVVFPAMLYLAESRIATGRVVDLYRAQNVPVVDVADLVKNLSPRERVASPVETHASILVNHMVAETLYQEFVKMKLVK